MASAQDFNPALLYAQKQLGLELLSTIARPNEAVTDIHQNIREVLMRINKDEILTTGLSMEILWTRFRPRVCESIEQLNTLLKLEHLADKLDSLIWKSHVSLQDIGKLQNSIFQATDLIYTSDANFPSLAQVNCLLHLSKNKSLLRSLTNS